MVLEFVRTCFHILTIKSQMFEACCVICLKYAVKSLPSSSISGFWSKSFIFTLQVAFMVLETWITYPSVFSLQRVRLKTFLSSLHKATKTATFWLWDQNCMLWALSHCSVLSSCVHSFVGSFGCLWTLLRTEHCC